MPKKKKKAEKAKQQDEAKKVVQASEGPLKEMLVNYVGEKHSPENNEVTVEMIVETVANEFPDFLLVVAKENWIRGYQQAMFDVENLEKEYESAVQ
jgi:hypothetical protein